MYSDGAINSIVLDLISGLRVGSPYVLLTGSYWNSSGTAKEIALIRNQSRELCYSRLTFIDSITQIAFPFFAIYEKDEGIDVRSTYTAPNDCCTTDDGQILQSAIALD